MNDFASLENKLKALHPVAPSSHLREKCLNFATKKDFPSRRYPFFWAAAAIILICFTLWSNYENNRLIAIASNPEQVLPAMKINGFSRTNLPLGKHHPLLPIYAEKEADLLHLRRKSEIVNLSRDS